MEAVWWILYSIFAGLAIVQSLLLALQTWEHRRYARSCMRKLERHQPVGRVLLCVPCKGRDLNLEDNLHALLEQDYDDYEVAFIVESADDPACPAIRRVMGVHSWIPARLIVAGRAVESGQKVHNLRVATSRLSPRIKFLAFADSDARPRPEWLRLLIARLHRPKMGAVTGYRWFVPQRDTMVNNLLYSLNCNIMSLLGRSSHYMIWGGSWAIRREVFDRIGLHAAWKGTLSDDLVASRLLAETKLQVRFEPVCVTASPIDQSLLEALSFVRRQYFLSRFYARDLWIFAALSALFTTLVWLVNPGVFFWGLLRGAGWTWIPLAVTSLLYLLSVYRGLMRQDLADLYYPHLRRALRRAKRFDIWLHPLSSLINGVVIWSSAFGRQIMWRRIIYRLAAKGNIEHSWRIDDPAVLPVPGVADNTPAFTHDGSGYRKAG